jgi:hypothetical protein
MVMRSVIEEKTKPYYRDHHLFGKTLPIDVMGKLLEQLAGILQFFIWAIIGFLS